MLNIGLNVFIAASFVASAAPYYETLLLGRIELGVGSSAARIKDMIVVRDLFHGPQVARVIFLIMTVFIIAPILVQLVGQTLLWFLVFVTRV